MEVSGQLHTPDTLPLEKSPLVPITWEAGWTPGHVWTLWKGRKFLVLPRIESQILHIIIIIIIVVVVVVIAIIIIIRVDVLNASVV
jgi:hypothetical protein